MDAQHVEQVLRVAFDRPHVVVLEDLRPHALEHPSVLEHVRHARGRAQVVFQHEQFAARVANEIAAHHVGVHAERHVHAAQLAPIAARAEDELGRQDPGAQDPLSVIDVVEEQVERANALLEAARDAIPFVRDDDARDEVEGHDLLHPLGPLVHREGDPADAERQVGGATTALDLLRAQRRQSPRQRLVVRARRAGRGEHLVPEAAQVVGRERRAWSARREGQRLDAWCAHFSSTIHAFFRAVKCPVTPWKVPLVGVTSAKSRPTATVM